MICRSKCCLYLGGEPLASQTKMSPMTTPITRGSADFCLLRVPVVQLPHFFHILFPHLSPYCAAQTEILSPLHCRRVGRFHPNQIRVPRPSFAWAGGMRVA
jgi:hypothetical protein